jgi:hypothetical protein
LGRDAGILIKDYRWQVGRDAGVLKIRDGRWEGMLAF